MLKENKELMLAWVDHACRSESFNTDYYLEMSAMNSIDQISIILSQERDLHIERDEVVFCGTGVAQYSCHEYVEWELKFYITVKFEKSLLIFTKEEL